MNLVLSFVRPCVGSSPLHANRATPTRTKRLTFEIANEQHSSLQVHQQQNQRFGIFLPPFIPERQDYAFELSWICEQVNVRTCHVSANTIFTQLESLSLPFIVLDCVKL